LIDQNTDGRENYHKNREFRFEDVNHLRTEFDGGLLWVTVLDFLNS
jgi:hypothetical protein